MILIPRRVSASLFGLGIALALIAGPVAGPAQAQEADAPGASFRYTIADLPAPHATPSTASPPRVVPAPADATLAVPAGFKVNVFAEGLDHPRNLLVTPQGDVLVAESSAGKVTILRDPAGTGAASARATLVEGLAQPFGLALKGDVLFIGDTRAIWQGTWAPGAEGVADLRPLTRPGQFGTNKGHWTRNIALTPDGAALYIAIGSEGNIAEEPSPRATIQILPLPRGEMRTFATGLRNPVGLAVQPGTGQVFTVVNERDTLGDELVPDYLTSVREGGFYGWPYAYLGNHPEPSLVGKRPDLVAAAIVPDVLFRSHSAPIGLVFYTATQFPERYRGGAFVAHRGSWNAAVPRGYKVVFVPFEGTKPTGGYETFATGFRQGGEKQAQVIGRPAGLAVAKDGSLLIADDTGKRIWRVSYAGG